MGKLKRTAIFYLAFSALFSVVSYAVLYLFHPVYVPAVEGEPVGLMWLADKMWRGEVGKCEGLVCSYGGVSVYFGEGVRSLEVGVPVSGNYTWFKTDILSYSAISMGNIEQRDLDWAVEYNRAHARALYLGRFTYNFTVYVDEEPPEPRLLAYRGEEDVVIAARKMRVHYTLLYPNIRPGVLVEGSQWVEDKRVTIGNWTYGVLLGYYYNYTLLLNGKPVLKSPLRSVISIQGNDAVWNTVWPKDGDLAYTENSYAKSSYSVRNALVEDYAGVLGSLRRGWNNLTLVVDVYLLDDAIDPVQGTRYITARLARGAVTLRLGPPFIMLLEARRTVDWGLYVRVLAVCILLAALPTYIVYRVRVWEGA